LYYKKLMENYLETECHLYYPENLLESLSFYIKQIKDDPGLKYVNPYNFAKENKIAIENSLKFLMYFTDPNKGVLNINAFIECFDNNCVHETLFFDDAIDNQYLICPECSSDYLITEIMSFTKVYFTIREPLLTIPHTTENSVDKNSTFEILNGLDFDLKSESPSSPKFDEGDKSVPLESVVQNNISPSGNPITKALPCPDQRLIDKLSSRRYS
jgi:hypothetical protein